VNAVSIGENVLLIRFLIVIREARDDECLPTLFSTHVLHSTDSNITFQLYCNVFKTHEKEVLSFKVRVSAHPEKSWNYGAKIAGPGMF
jgi:hypothetical protein